MHLKANQNFSAKQKILRTLIFKFTVSIIIGDLNDDLRDVELPLTYCVAGSGGL